MLFSFFFILLGNEEGEPFLPERQIRIMDKPLKSNFTIFPNFFLAIEFDGFA